MDELLLLAGDSIWCWGHGNWVIMSEEQDAIKEALLRLAGDDGRSAAASPHGNVAILQIELCELVV